MKPIPIRAIGISLFLLGLAGAAVYLADRAENERVSKAPMETVKRSPSSSSAAPSEPVEMNCNTAGQICTIKDLLGNGLTLAATSLRSYEEMMKLLRANDNVGIAQMARDQEIIGPKPGDKVRVLDHSAFNGRIEARITTGELQGRKVWMSTAWVRGQ